MFWHATTAIVACQKLQAAQPLLGQSKEGFACHPQTEIAGMTESDFASRNGSTALLDLPARDHDYKSEV
jgi:hypothetical protein